MGGLYRNGGKVITYISPVSEEDYQGLHLAKKLNDYYKAHQNNIPDLSLQNEYHYHELYFPNAHDP